MTIRRLLLGSLLAGAAALPVAIPSPAHARVFVGVGLGFPVVPFGYPYYYAPPPVVYAPPPAYYPPPAYSTGAVARCVAPNLTCPLRDARPVGAACGCPDAFGRYLPGRVG